MHYFGSFLHYFQINVAIQVWDKLTSLPRRVCVADYIQCRGQGLLLSFCLLNLICVKKKMVMVIYAVYCNHVLFTRKFLGSYPLWAPVSRAAANLVKISNVRSFGSHLF